MKNKWMILFWVMAALLISGCAASQSPVKEVAGAPSEALVEQLAQEIAGAKADDVDALAPDLFDKAQTAFLKARQGLERGARPTAVNEHVTESRNFLAQAATVAATARGILKDIDAARDKAIKAGAEALGQPFKDVEARNKWLSQAIKNNDINYAVQNAESVQADYRKVEIMAIKHEALAPSRQLMEKATRQRLDKLVPRSYGEAGRALHTADEYIGQNPYEEKAIADQAAHALFLAQRMNVVNQVAGKLDPMTAEDRVFFLEKHLATLSSAMEVGDLRNLPPEEQVVVMVDAVDDLKAANQSLTQLNQSYQNQIAAMEQRIKGLQGFSKEQEAAKKRLAAEREFNERFDKVQNYFTSKEAEVYKQGNQLVIRMRGIQFPVGQATLTADNYSLLSKVQRAIRTFESASVLIEGHTDNTGSADLNKRLSLERARAVQAYLVANDAGMVDRISARGYGSERPLASNDTAEGRAVNRRIDVLIKPNPIN